MFWGFSTVSLGRLKLVEVHFFGGGGGGVVKGFMVVCVYVCMFGFSWGL